MQKNQVYVDFKIKKKIVDTPPNIITVQGVKIEQVQVYKYLGIKCSLKKSPKQPPHPKKGYCSHLITISI